MTIKASSSNSLPADRDASDVLHADGVEHAVHLNENPTIPAGVRFPKSTIHLTRYRDRKPHTISRFDMF